MSKRRQGNYLRYKNYWSHSGWSLTIFSNMFILPKVIQGEILRKVWFLNVYEFLSQKLSAWRKIFQQILFNQNCQKDSRILFCEKKIILLLTIFLLITNLLTFLRESTLDICNQRLKLHLKNTLVEPTSL